MVSRVPLSSLARELLGRVDRLQKRLGDTQSQVSSQRRIQVASDDPAGAANAARLRSKQADTDALRRGLGFAKTVVAAQDNALDGAETVLTRVREIAALTASGSNSPTSRTQASVEVAELERQLIALANADVSGQYVFAGLSTAAPPFTGLDDPGFNPLAPYVGPTESFSVRTATDETIELARRGDGVFSDAIAAVDELRVTLAAGSPPTASIDALAAADADLRAERAVVGVRARIINERDDDLRAGRLDLEARIGAIEGTDLTESITRLVQLQTTLQATLESAHVLQASILDSVRL